MEGKVIKATVILYLGDNLEMMDIGGFQKDFHHGQICRWCLIKHKVRKISVLSFNLN